MLRRRRCGINEGTRSINQPFDETAGTADVAAACAERLAQRSHLNIDIFIHVFRRSQSAAIWTNYSDSVRFIEQ